MSEMGAAVSLKKAVFFDLYGTLIDIETDEHDLQVFTTLSQYLSYHAVNVDPGKLRGEFKAVTKSQISQSREMYPETDVFQIFDILLRKFGHRRHRKQIIMDTVLLYRALTIRRFVIFPGVYHALESICRRFKTAIISDAQWSFTVPEIKKLGLDRYFRRRIFSSRYGFMKPDRRLFTIACDMLGVTPENTVYIGDNPSKDLVGSKVAGMKCILFGSTRGPYHGYQPDGFFIEYSELPKILDNVFSIKTMKSVSAKRQEE